MPCLLPAELQSSSSLFTLCNTLASSCGCRSFGDQSMRTDVHTPHADLLMQDKHRLESHVTALYLYSLRVYTCVSCLMSGNVSRPLDDQRERNAIQSSQCLSLCPWRRLLSAAKVPVRRAWLSLSKRFHNRRKVIYIMCVCKGVDTKVLCMTVFLDVEYDATSP